MLSRSLLPYTRIVAIVATLIFVPPAAFAVCGDGQLDSGEVCDDGNLSEGDCCSASCELVECEPQAQPLVAWEAQGPFDIGGRITAVAVDPMDSNQILVGTIASGVWRSHDRGLSWVAIAPWLDVTEVSAIAIDPGDSDAYLIGTGQLADSGTVSDGLGLMKTPTGGIDWEMQADPFATAYIADILVWDSEPARVITATDRGLRLSLDGGRNFAAISAGDSFSAIAQDPFDPDGAYATGRAGVYRSYTRGASWDLVSPWPDLTEDDIGIANTALAVSEQTPDKLVVTVQILSTFIDTDRVMFFESTDGGATLNELPTPNGLCPLSNLCGFANAVALHPLDDDKILLGGDELFFSDDGGLTFFTYGPGIRGVNELVVSSDGVVVGGRSGVAVLDANWDFVGDRNAGLPITGVVSLDVVADPSDRVLVGSRDGGTLLGTGDPIQWDIVFGDREMAGMARFDPFDPDTLYASKIYGDLHRSDDGGLSFLPITAGLDPTQIAARVAPISPNPLIPGHLYTGRLQVYESSDRGDLWQEYRPLGAPEVSLIEASPADDDRVFFSIAGGATLFKADNIHTDIYTLSTNLDDEITSIWPDRDFGHTIYVTLTNNASQQGVVVRTTDFGVTWEDRNWTTLPAILDFAKDDDDTLYIATSDGVYRSPSEGFTWSRFNEGIPTNSITTLALGDGTLYAGTRGRGVYRISTQPLSTIDTIPPGQRLVIDGELRHGPVYENWAAGSEHTIAPYLLQTVDERQEFVGWLDGGSAEHTFTSTAGNDWNILAVKVLYRLNTTVDPPQGGRVILEPPSTDSFYPLQSIVQVLAVPEPDYRLVGFEGDPSGVDRVLAVALMDKPRSVEARFEPLVLTLRTLPIAIDLTIDGVTEATPVSHQWAAGTLHPVSAPEFVDENPADPVVLAFDSWSDYLDREHDYEMRRDTFTPDLVARYIPTVPSLPVPPNGIRVLRTEGTKHPLSEMSLILQPDALGEELPQTMQVVRGIVAGDMVTEFVLPRAVLRTRVDAYVEGRGLVEGGGLLGSGRIRRTRLSVFNPGTEAASISMTLHDRDGNATAGGNDLIEVPPGSRSVVLLDDLLGLGNDYEGLVSVVSDQPVAIGILLVGENLRYFDFTDPILLHLFDNSAEGVPQGGETQVLLATPNTEHVVVLANTGAVPIDGQFTFRDETGAPFDLAIDGTLAATHPYSIAPGGFRLIRAQLPAALPGTAFVAHARLDVTADAGSPQPLMYDLAERVVGTSRYGDLLLPRSLPPSRQSDNFTVPVELGLRDSAVVMTNRSGTDSLVILLLHDEAGTPILGNAVILPADGQSLISVRDFFPQVNPEQRGFLSVDSSQTIDAVGVFREINGRGEEILAGFPVLDHQPTAPDTAQHYTYALDGDSWTSEWWFLNESDAPRVASIIYRTGDGTTRHLPIAEPAAEVLP